MEDLRHLFRCAGLGEQCAEALAAGGWSVARLGTLHGGGIGLRNALQAACRARVSGFDIDDADLVAVVQMAHGWSEAARKVEAKRGASSWLEAHERHEREVRRKLLQARELEDISEKVTAKGLAKRARWPSRLGKKIALAGDDIGLREAAERQERARWSKELKKILVEAKLPASTHGSFDGETDLGRIAKGRRASTLRKHVKTCQRVAKWLSSVYGISWPNQPSQLASYIEAMLAEPCARSFPESVYRTFIFLEFSGEVAQHEQIHRAPAIQNCLEEAKLVLEAKEIRAKRQANIMPVALAVALENFVCDNFGRDYDRCYAWYRLVKLWSGMRFSDTQGIPSRTVMLEDFGLKAEIYRSKTSGPGKKIQLLQVFVSKDAWIACPHWLACGWAIWRSMGTQSGMTSRDFMLPFPNEARSGFVRKVVDYQTASTMSQALFSALWTEQNGVRSTLLFNGVGVVWTEHSERATLRTWAQAARIPDDVKKQLGRWRPSADEGYERAARVNVLRSQLTIAEYIKTNLGRADPFDETSVLRQAESLLRQAGMPEEAVAEQTEQLSSFTPVGQSLVEAVAPQWALSGPVQFLEFSEVDHAADAGATWPIEQPAFGDDDADDETQRQVEHAGRVVTLDEISGMYVVSIVGRSMTRTLHRIGECFRQPGLHYHHYEVLGDEPPSSDLYHKACRVCFPQGHLKARTALGDESSDDVSSSDSETSGED